MVNTARSRSARTTRHIRQVDIDAKIAALVEKKLAKMGLPLARDFAREIDERNKREAEAQSESGVVPLHTPATSSVSSIGSSLRSGGDGSGSRRRHRRPRSSVHDGDGGGDDDDDELTYDSDLGSDHRKSLSPAGTAADAAAAAARQPWRKKPPQHVSTPLPGADFVSRLMESYRKASPAKDLPPQPPHQKQQGPRQSGGAAPTAPLSSLRRASLSPIRAVDDGDDDDRSHNNGGGGDDDDDDDVDDEEESRDPRTWAEEEVRKAREAVQNLSLIHI